MGDATFFPSDQLELVSPIGTYRVQAKVIDYGIDRRIGRLRAVLAEHPAEAHYIGDISVGFAVVGVCDHPVFLAALEQYGTDLEQYNAKYSRYLDDERGYGRITLRNTPEATMVFVRAGWGDGRYRVYELRQAAQLIGIEVVFIEPDEQYIFEDVSEYAIIGGSG